MMQRMCDVCGEPIKNGRFIRVGVMKTVEMYEDYEDADLCSTTCALAYIQKPELTERLEAVENKPGEPGELILAAAPSHD